MGPDAASPIGSKGIWRWGAFGFGFLYWFGFVLVLEPGNVMRGGGGLPLGQELIRLTGAGLLGAAVTPLVFALAERTPVEDGRDARRIGLHLGVAVLLAAALIVISTVLAVLLLSEERRPFGQALPSEFAANGPLLFFFLLVLDAIAHGYHFLRRLGAATVLPDRGVEHLATVAVKDRERTQIVALADVGWIESQGNYVALHAGGRTHLIRETLARFESRLDPARFARIHRRTIVAVPRVKEIAALPGGDATVTLDDGTALRLSRSFREAFKARIAGS